MPNCALLTCKNTNRNCVGKGIKFHHFPKDEAMRMKWFLACKNDKINFTHACVCSDHFTPQDYERDLRNELLGLPIVKRLKKDAVPSQKMDGPLPFRRNAMRNKDHAECSVSLPKRTNKNKKNSTRKVKKRACKRSSCVSQKRRKIVKVHAECSSTPLQKQKTRNKNIPPSKTKKLTSANLKCIPPKKSKIMEVHTDCFVSLSRCTSKNRKEQLQEVEDQLSENLSNFCQSDSNMMRTNSPFILVVRPAQDEAQNKSFVPLTDCTEQNNCSENLSGIIEQNIQTNNTTALSEHALQTNDRTDCSVSLTESNSKNAKFHYNKISRLTSNNQGKYSLRCQSLKKTKFDVGSSTEETVTENERISVLEKEIMLLKRETDLFQEEISKLECENRNLKRRLLDSGKKIKDGKKKVNEEVKKECINILGKIFTENQIDYLITGRQRVFWTEEDIAKARTLRAISRDCYFYLRNELKFPLPSRGTLTKSARKNPKIMQTTADVAEHLDLLSEVALNLQIDTENS